MAVAARQAVQQRGVGHGLHRVVAVVVRFCAPALLPLELCACSDKELKVVKVLIRHASGIVTQQRKACYLQIMLLVLL